MKLKRSKKTFQLTLLVGALVVGVASYYLSTSLPISLKAQSSATVDLSADRTTINAGEQVVLSWNNTGVSECQARSSDNSWSSLYTGAQALSGSVTMTNVNGNITYFLTCTQSDGGGAQASSPDAPILTGSEGSGQVTISWQEPANNGSAIDRYQIDRSVGSGWSTLSSSHTSRSYTDTGLTNGTSYTYRVRAHNSTGWGAWSSSLTLIPSP